MCANALRVRVRLLRSFFLIMSTAPAAAAAASPPSNPTIVTAPVAATATDTAGTATPPPPSPGPPASPALRTSRFRPLVCVVDFNHHRGPEIEHWIGAEPEAGDPTAQNDWQLIPYMALPDGAHQSEEEFSYFSLVHKPHRPEGVDAAPPPPSPPTTSVFGISCMHQIDSAELLFRPPEVTRSAVQKAVVAITDQPQGFGALRQRLSIVTRAWFAQKDFRDLDILQVGLIHAGAEGWALGFAVVWEKLWMI